MNLLHLTLPTLGAVVIELTPGAIAAFCGCVTGVAAVIALLVKFVRWVDHQKAQDKEQADLKKKHDADMAELRTELDRQNRDIQHELTVICYGLKGALQGLIETGCNGPCKEALKLLDKHLNKAAHDEVNT